MLKKYPNLNEGDLTKKRAKIVNFKTLAKVAKKLKINKYIETGKSLRKTNDKILSDCYESIIGAIFLDIWSAETNIIKALIGVGSTALFAISLFFVEKKNNE